MPKLIFNDPETDQEVSLTIGDDQPEVTVGRNPGNTLRVNNPSISRRHAKFVWENNEVTLYDLDSSNGSYVNGHRIRSQVLVHEDRLRIGEFPVLFHDEVDAATAEVDADAIESVLQQSGAKQTNLGGFGGPPPPPVDPFGNAYEPQPMPEEAGEASFGQPEGYGPESYGFSNEAPIFDPPSFDNKASQGASRPPQFSSPLGHNWGDDEPIELEPDLSDFDAADALQEHGEEMFGGEARSGYEDLGSAPSIGEDDLDTRNAMPGEIANKLSEFVRQDEPPGYDSTVEQSVEDFMALRAQASRGDVDLQAALDEMTRERDELAEILQNRAGDAGAASQLQIDRLRKERDRLSDERRNLLRQINDFKKLVDEAPSRETLQQLQQKVADLEAQVRNANDERSEAQRGLRDRDARIEALQAEIDELKAAASERDALSQRSAELGEQLSSAHENLVGIESELQQLREENGRLHERLQGAETEIEQLDQEISARDEKLASYTELIDNLQVDLSERDAQNEELRVALEEFSSDLDAKTTRVAQLEAELRERPVAEEMADLRNRLTAVEANAQALESERDGLLKRSSELQAKLIESQQLVDAINERYAKIGSEFDSVRKERDDLKDERVAFARETDYLQVERRRLTEEVEDLRKRVKASEKETKRKKQIFEELSGDLRKLVQENNALQDEVKSLQESVDRAPSQERVAELESQLRAAQEQVVDLEQDNAGLTRDLGKFFEEKTALEERVESLQSELDAARASAATGQEAAQAVSRLTEERQVLQAQIDELRPNAEALEAAMSELESWREQGEASKARIAELEAQVENAAVAEVDAAKVMELQKKLDDAEQTLAAIILERDKLEDDLKKFKSK